MPTLAAMIAATPRCPRRGHVLRNRATGDFELERCHQRMQYRHSLLAWLCPEHGLMFASAEPADRDVQRRRQEYEDARQAGAYQAARAVLEAATDHLAR